MFKNILDPSFVYVPACRTDIRRTFARVRKEMKKQAEPKTETKVFYPWTKGRK